MIACTEPKKPYWVEIEVKWDDRYPTAEREPDLLVAPVTLPKAGVEEPDESVAGVERGLDDQLPLLSGLDVVVSHEGIHAAEAQV